MNKKYVFAGNRAFVLEKMLDLGLEVVKIWAVKNSYLQKYLDQKKLKYFLIEKREIFISEVINTEFDYFVSNGLPIILPISRMEDCRKKFINIHPSPLPDLRGKDPVPGAILYRRDSGATCHYMNDKIDSGDIISQVIIPYSPDWEAGMLYQLSFQAEALAFESAYKRQFEPLTKQQEKGNEIYYSFKEEDLVIHMEKETSEEIISKVRAFATGNKGAVICYEGKRYKCWNVEFLSNRYLEGLFAHADENEVIMQYENKKLVKKEKGFLLFTLEEG